MDNHTFEIIYSRLEKSKIEALAEEYDVREETLSAILNLKLVRHNKNIHNRFKRNPEKILKQWENGESILKISFRSGLSPVLVALFITNGEGYTRKGSRRILKKPELIENERLRRDISKAIEKDFLYSPWAHELQIERAKLGEKILGEWLIRNGAVFTEGNNSNKTPDFLFEKPLFLEGKEIYWADSKAIFADEKEHKRYISKQFADYLEIFGSGMVAYWYGFVDTLPTIEPKIIIKDYSSISDPSIEKLFVLVR